MLVKVKRRNIIIYGTSILRGKEPAMRKIHAVLVFGAVVLLALSALSCGGEKAKEETGPTSPSESTTKKTTATASGGAITAKEAMQLLAAKAGGWASDAVPVSLGPIARGKTVEGGRCEYWGATFYSASKREAYVFDYFQGEVSQAASPMFQGVDWQVGDLQAAWRVDSPEAASIASGQGITEITSMDLSLRQYRPDRNPPPAVPASCQVYWEIEGKDGKTLYVDAASGAVLGWK